MWETVQQIGPVALGGVRSWFDEMWQLTPWLLWENYLAPACVKPVAVGSVCTHAIYSCKVKMVFCSENTRAASVKIPMEQNDSLKVRYSQTKLVAGSYLDIRQTLIVSHANNIFSALLTQLRFDLTRAIFPITHNAKLYRNIYRGHHKWVMNNTFWMEINIIQTYIWFPYQENVAKSVL